MEEIKKNEARRGQVSGTPEKKIKILYVEDEDLNWEVTLLNMRSRYDISRARDAKEAVAQLMSKSFHAILMDIQLSNSDFDGIGITALIRGTAKLVPPYAKEMKPSTIPIIFMTAYSARYSRDDLLAKGGDELVTKPVDFIHLGLCLSRCLLKNLPK